MAIFLEHANITVPDIEQAIEFLKVVEPSFYIRGQGKSQDSGRWLHFGNEETYIALQEPTPGAEPQPRRTPYENYGVNHLAWVVDDFDAVIKRLEEHGFKQGLIVEPHRFRKRAYYFDSAGFEWEIIEYLSENVTERNVYEAE